MTNPPSPPSDLDASAGTLELILQSLLPVLLLSSLSVHSFPGRWRLLRAKLTQLQSFLADSSSGGGPHHPLFRDLLPSLLSTLRSLHSLSDRCHDPSLPGGKLLLQSDLDIAASALSLYLHDLDLLLRSCLLHHPHHHHYPNAIVLSHPGPNSSKEDLALFVRDLFARLQIGGIDLKKKALDSLLRLLDSAAVAGKISAIVVQEGDLTCLIHLLDSSNHSLIREQAAAAVSTLATASDLSRKAVFEEGGLGPLLRLLEKGSASGKEKAAVAIEAITADPANAWAVSAYGGISILIEACKSTSFTTRARAAGTLRNIALAVGDVRKAMVEEGAIPVLVELLLSGEEEVRKNAAHCLWIMASSSEGEQEEDFRVSIVEEGGLQKLIQLFIESSGSDPEFLDHVLRAIHCLSDLAAGARVLSSSSGFLIQLAELINYGNAATQHMSASLLCNLSPSEECKRSMAGCMGTLVKMMESSKPVNSQEVSAMALVSLLAVRSNTKDFVRDEKSVTRLVQMLDPRNEAVYKKFPVMVVSALAAGGNGCRKRLSATGASPYLQKLADIDVPGAKKALQRITGNRLMNIFSSISWRE